MFENGLPEEVRALRARHPALSPTAAHAIGYREAALLLDGELSLGDAVAQTALRTRQLAKRQLTWFRHQARVHWIDVPPDASPADVASAIAALLPTLPPVPLLALG
jgi:tRNA dimethylallyltransferase